MSQPPPSPGLTVSGDEETGLTQVSGLSRPILYMVAYSSEDDGDNYSPIVTSDRYLSEDGVTAPHHLTREMVPTLRALWYCLHLPKTPHDLVYPPIEIAGELHAVGLAHQIALAPMPVIERYLAARELAAPIKAIIIGPDNEQERLNDIAREFRFLLPPAPFSTLSTASLRSHWAQLKDLIARDVLSFGVGAGLGDRDCV